MSQRTQVGFFGFNKLSVVLVSSGFSLPSQIPCMYICHYLPCHSSEKFIFTIKKRSNSLNKSSSSDTKPDSAAIFKSSNMGKTWTFVDLLTLKSLFWHIHSAWSWLLWLLLLYSIAAAVCNLAWSLQICLADLQAISSTEAWLGKPDPSERLSEQGLQSRSVLQIAASFSPGFLLDQTCLPCTVI